MFSKNSQIELRIAVEFFLNTAIYNNFLKKLKLFNLKLYRMKNTTYLHILYIIMYILKFNN